MSRARILSDSCRSQLYLGLARALDAGMDPVSALAAINDTCGGVLRNSLERCMNAVRKGSALSATLYRHGLISELDRTLVNISEEAGRLEYIFDELATRYERAHLRFKKMKGRLMLPAVVTILAIFALPMPALFAQRITLATYIMNTSAMIALVLFCVYALRNLVTHWRTYGSPTLFTRIVRTFPVLRRISIAQERAQVCDALALSLISGVAATQAMDRLAHAQHNTVRRHNLMRARRTLNSGQPVADSLRTAGLLDEAGGFAIVSAGEQAGRLEQALRHHAQALNQDLDNTYDVMARWIPILTYLCVASVIAAGIVG